MHTKRHPVAAGMVLFTVLWFALSWQSATGQVKKGQEGRDTKLLRHVVLFKFKESATPEEIKAIEEAFRALPQKIDAVVDFEWGTNNSPEGLNKGFTHCFFVTFKDEEGRKAYLPHPAHKEFVSLLRPSLEDVLVVDYWTQE